MKFEDLKFVRIDRADLFELIPRRFFEQVKDNTYDIDKMYELAPTFVKSPMTRIYALMQEGGKMRGILWAYVNILTKSIQVQILSIDKEFQFDNALGKTLEFVKSWMGEDEKLRIECITTRPRAYEKNGWRRSKRTILEIS